MSRKQLTSKQHAFLAYLRKFIEENDVWPTYREIVDYFGYRSPNSVTQNLQALYKKGFLSRTQDGYELPEQAKKNWKPMGIPIKGIISAGRLQEAVE